MTSEDVIKVAGQLLIVFATVVCISCFFLCVLVEVLSKPPGPEAKKSHDECKALLEDLPKGAPKTGELWRCLNGAQYYVETVALGAHSLKPIVIYCDCLDLDLVWARDLDDWMSSIETAEGPVPRFTRDTRGTGDDPGTPTE